MSRADPASGWTPTVRKEADSRASRPGATWRYLLLALALLALASMLATIAGNVWLPTASPAIRILAATLIFLPLAGLACRYLLVLPVERHLLRIINEQTTRASHAEERLRAQENDARLQHALEIAEDETAVLRIAEQSLAAVAGESGAQLLMASDPDGEIDHSNVIGDMDPAAKCVIRRPRECPTVRRGQGMVYEDGMALSACRGLNGQIDAGCAAACMPVFVGGRGTGMIRTLGKAEDPALYRQLQSLAFNAHQVGTRLAVIRSVAASEAKATTDPLTGLFNRRALDARLAILLDQQAPFALAIADIDHFKKINDTYGHEVGDRALKVVASTFKQTVRRHDLVCRFGGEEFVLLLVGMDIESGTELVERIRSELPRQTTRGGVPAFTISAGVVDHQDATDGETLLRVADALLYEAKASGRDRVCTAKRPLAGSDAGGQSKVA